MRVSNKNRVNRRNIGWYLVFIMPGLSYIIFFVAFPILYNILLSFQEVTASTLLSGSRDFVDWQNYADIFANPKFVGSIQNTLVFTLASIAFQFVFGFLLALLFAKNFF